MHRYRQGVLLTTILVLLFVMLSFAFFTYRVLSHPSGPSLHAPTLKRLLQPAATRGATILHTPQASMNGHTTHHIHATPTLQDPLNANNGAWTLQSVSGSGTCQFRNGALQISEAQNNQEAFCLRTGSTFQNGKLQIDVTLSGQGMAGLVFRAYHASGQTTLYCFGIRPDGSYGFGTYTRSVQGNTQSSSFSSHSASQSGTNIPNAVRTGDGVNNTLTVVAQGSSFAFSINGQYVTTVHDNTLSTGQIGIFAADEQAPASATFRNLQMWTQ